MPDPQPSAAAMRLADAAWCAVQNFGTDGLSDDERVVRIAIALDDAGVGKAVEQLDEIKEKCVQYWNASALNEAEMHAVLEFIHARTFALTGDDDAT